MNTKEEQDDKIKVKRYKIQHPISAYTFPTEAHIHQIGFDDDSMQVDLSDGRKISIPLWWIPTLYNASPEEREKYEIDRRRMMIIWNPAKCKINDEISIIDYLGPDRPGQE